MGGANRLASFRFEVEAFILPIIFHYSLFIILYIVHLGLASCEESETVFLDALPLLQVCRQYLIVYSLSIEYFQTRHF